MNNATHSTPHISLGSRFPGRARAWQLRTHRLEFGNLPQIMGIVNVTPDSFSDGGKFFETQRAIDHALQLAEEGADVLDIGGESTRPYATPLSADEELSRVLPVVQAVCRQSNVPVSCDTSKASVAKACLEAGAEAINDVTGFTGDPRMIEVLKTFSAGACAMHMQGTPQTMQDHPTYHNVTDDILLYLRQRRDALLDAGIDRERICLDPGIGFGKSHQHNLDLLANCGHFHQLECPLLVGHSRKGFIGKVLNDKNTDRLAGTTGVALALAARGIQLLRVHDVRFLRQALRLFAASGGVDGQAGKVE